MFRDGKCDSNCNRKECFFDGYDCDDSATRQCDKHFDGFCTDHFGNGRCDESCNNAACGWDGLDCVPPAESHKIIPGSLHVVLAISKEQFDESRQKRFVRYLSLVMRTNFRIKTENGEPMIYKYTPSMLASTDYSFRTNLVEANLGIVVYLEIDNLKCSGEQVADTSSQCISDIEGYKDYFTAMVGNSKETSEDWGIVEVGFSKAEKADDGKENYGIAIGLVIIALIVISVGVIVQTQKKKAKGVTWFPDGFLPTTQSTKRKNDAQEMFGFGHMGANIDGWSDDDPLEHPTKKMRRVGGDFPLEQTLVPETDQQHDDGRQWTQHHLNAAGNVGMLTPPQAETFLNDVDVKGPMGMTALMIASMRGSGLDSSNCENFEDNSADIQGLISQNADLHAQMEKTGETPLHLSARHARADAAKKLLDNGADVNAQDNSGRTPLHAAIASDAQGVFHILMKNRATNLNAKTFDGTTPLILAARLAIEGMVDLLIEAEVDVNLADDQGKTALHWAASVNNIEAVNVLLANGANRDAQDNKDETPLFLAAREGSYQAARALLDHCANRDIQDHMDRLPIHVAHERMHQDIVQLLEEHIPPAPPLNASLPSLVASGQMFGCASQMNGHLNSVQPLMGTKPKTKKRPKANSPNGTEMFDDTSVSNTGTLSRMSNARKPSIKRKRAEEMPAYDSPVMMNQQMQFGSRGPLATSHPNFEDLMNKRPPSYEAAVTSQQQHSIARSMQSLQGGMPGQPSLKVQYSSFIEGPQQQQQQQQHQQQLHNRQQSMPASVPSYSSHLSPPHSNLSQHMQSPPPQTSFSPPSHGILMSPPQSVQSNHTMSPPSHHNNQNMSPPQHQQQQQQLSPTKSSAARSIQLPTSPTHMAAMRGATHQKIQSFDFTNVPQFGQQFVYPGNQTSLMNDGFNADGGFSSFMTPSPDSPGVWSPQSHSDWSDGGMLSPPAAGMNQFQHHHQQQQQQQHQMLQHQQQTDSVLI